MAATLAAFFIMQSAQAAPAVQQTVNAETTRVILVGDSTMATRTGYGDALCSLFQPHIKCVNLARGGRSSKSFRVEGLWDNVMTLLRIAARDNESKRITYVLIQFGHNDQPGKPERSTDLVTEFPVNITRYVDEVRSLGGLPVLVTPLTRRTFRNGTLRNDLVPWADVIRQIAKVKSVPLIDLNATSAAAVALMGTTEADTLAEEPPPKVALPTSLSAVTDQNRIEPNGVAKSRFDYTHLGAKGATLFSKMVAGEMVQAVPALAAHLRTDA